MGKKIEETLSLMGFAWIEDETGEVNWALKEDFEDVAPQDRPDGATPVVIEITPTQEWFDKQKRDHEFLGDLQEQMSRFTGTLSKLERDLGVKKGG